MFVIETRIGPSEIHGIGVFSREDVPAGAVVWRYHAGFDRLLNEAELADLPPAFRRFLDDYAYRAADLGGGIVLSCDHARFLNHSDDPNTVEEPFVSRARRPIRAGDEITCDYGAFCTGWTGFDGARTIALDGVS